MGKLNKIFKISSTDFATLKETGQITKAGVTYKYDPDNLYLIENNLTDDYVLLGAGGSKLESELSVKKAVSADSATTTNSIIDYNNASNKINIGWYNDAMAASNIHSLACYTRYGIKDGAAINIKNTTKAEVSKWLDLTESAINGEAYLKWGGKNLVNTVSPSDAGLVPKLSANRFDFCPTNHIKVEYSTDGGTTWVNYEATDDAKTSLVSSVASYGDFYIGKKTLSSSEKTTLDRLKVTLFDFGNVIYTNLRKFMIYVATNANTNCWCTIRKNTKGNPDVFTEIATKVVVYGWSGWNVINVPEFATYGNSDKQATAIEFIFGADAAPYSNYQALCIRKIFAYHETCYSPITATYSMATAGTPYVLDVNKTAIFGYSVNAKKLYEDSQALTDKYALKTAIPTVESLTTTDIDDAIK